MKILTKILEEHLNSASILAHSIPVQKTKLKFLMAYDTHGKSTNYTLLWFFWQRMASSRGWRLKGSQCVQRKPLTALVHIMIVDVFNRLINQGS